jgi:hypothetical protein
MLRFVKRSGSPRWGVWLGAAACLCLSGSARADSLGCHGNIVSTGDSRYEVRSVCGEPDDAVQRVEYRTLRGRVAGPCTREGGRIRCSQTREEVVEVTIDEWIYDFGKNQFIEYLTFEQGRLVSVREGSYGHKRD